MYFCLSKLCSLDLWRSSMSLGIFFRTEEVRFFILGTHTPWVILLTTGSQMVWLKRSYSALLTRSQLVCVRSHRYVFSKEAPRRQSCIFPIYFRLYFLWTSRNKSNSGFFYFHTVSKSRKIGNLLTLPFGSFKDLVCGSKSQKNETYPEDKSRFWVLFFLWVPSVSPG